MEKNKLTDLDAMRQATGTNAQEDRSFSIEVKEGLRPASDQTASCLARYCLKLLVIVEHCKWFRVWGLEFRVVLSEPMNQTINPEFTTGQF